MNQTINYYNENTTEFINCTLRADMSESRDRFLGYLPENASILDAGCGSGRDSLAFKDAGHSVVAFDASEKICEEASKIIGQEVICLRFEDIEFEDDFDGIWACASLLHVERASIAVVMEKLYKALHNGGILYASFKYGESERNAGGRFFSDYNEESARVLFEKAGFEVLEIYATGDVREGRESEKWVNVIGRKC